MLFLWGPIRIFIVLTNWKKTGICLTNTNVWSVYFPKIFPSVAATCKHPCSTCGRTSSWMLCLTVRNNHFHNTNKFWHRPSLCKLSDQKTKGTSVKLSRCSTESVSVLHPRLEINPGLRHMKRSSFILSCLIAHYHQYACIWLTPGVYFKDSLRRNVFPFLFIFQDLLKEMFICCT